MYSEGMLFAVTYEAKLPNIDGVQEKYEIFYT